MQRADRQKSSFDLVFLNLFFDVRPVIRHRLAKVSQIAFFRELAANLKIFLPQYSRNPVLILK